MYQQITIVGNLGHDPQSRDVNGTLVTNFSVAANERWTDQSGEKHETTTWYRIAAWGRLAEVCAQYLSKGRSVMVIGRLKADPQTGGPRVYTKRDGTPGASFEVVARRVLFLGSGNGSKSAAPELPSEPAEGEDIPF